MKKLFSIFVMMTLVFSGTMSASASTITLSPVTVAVDPGETFSIVIKVDPLGQKLYTVKSSVSFPASLLEVVSFTQAGGWMPLSQPGYDSIGNGKIVKTAGYPGGFTATQVFGTITFKALTAGKATISIDQSSVAYDSQSANTISGTQGVAVATIIAPVPVVPVKPTAPVTPKTPTTPTTPTVAPVTPVEEPIVEESIVLDEQTPAEPELAVVPKPTSQSSLASLGSIISLGTNNFLIGLFFVLMLLVLSGYAIQSIRRRIRRNN